MSFPSTASSEIGKSRFWARRALPVAASLTAALLGCLIARPASAEDGQSIVKKMIASYSNLKSFSGSRVEVRTFKTADKKPASITSNQVLKYVAPNLVYVQVKQTSTGIAGPQGAPQEQLLVSDGKSVFMYVPQTKMYRKFPARPMLPIPFQDVSGLANVKPAPTYTLLPETASVGGHAAYVLRINFVIPANLPDAQKKAIAASGPPKLYIDKQNYHFLRIAVGKTDTNRSVTLTEQALNPSIPGSAFSFTPPAGVKLFVPPAAPAGVPGGVPIPAPHQP